MSIPQLFYLGLLAGILNRIPGVDLGSLIFALHLNSELYMKSSKKTFLLFAIINLGYMVTLFFPLSRFDVILYYHSDKILGFLTGYIIFTSSYLWIKNESLYRTKSIFLSFIVVMVLILFKSFQLKTIMHESMLVYILQGFSLLIPGMNSSINELPSFFALCFFIMGIIVSIYFLIYIQKNFEKFRLLIVAALVASLCDIWPWRAFQSFSYNVEGGKWIKDYPVLPEVELINILIVVIFFCSGILSSWLITKFHKNRIIIVHE